MANFISLASKAIESGGKLRVKSALNPALWLCGIVSIPALVIAIVKGDPPIWLITFIFIPVGLAAIGFLFFMLFDRDKLQSEDYQIKKKSLEIIEQKGDLSPILISNDDLKIIEKPNASLSLHEGEEK